MNKPAPLSQAVPHTGKGPTPENQVEFVIYSRYGLFTNPLCKLGGEKCSYEIPTYEAIRGVLRSIYSKPSFTWFVDDVRIMKTISTEGKGVLLPSYTGQASQLSYNCYLKNVAYQVRAHFEWNDNLPQYKPDWIWKKHLAIAKRAIEKGGYRDVFMGTSECVAYVEPCVFGEGIGAYDMLPEKRFPMMHHAFVYPEEAFSKESKCMITATMFEPVMKNGVIHFPRPEDCPVKRPIRSAEERVLVPKYNADTFDWEVFNV